ncbi:MetQ/NlpA family ABC transporter substrate-binding protein [Moorella sp. E306M]|uniref:MetQ/NlpA family ABC transporter substrate-binding protein n=1 Tax=Moorella sp. E306M TaxID=2572683 RepID=UPI0010FFB13F|nr:MetQ/NlpA family ABC transporter substrate-binding protein [Moorella sp. E306M]MDK2894617.1 D-methionine transport system substrate-binding protein [Moorella sp. (in: firmicutes)]GEA18708.1 lipoprotein [Moorella sp. E306M]
MKKIVVLALVLLTLGAVLTGCGQQQKASPGEAAKKEITVGATARPHAEILERIKPVLAQEGITLNIKVFNDYAQLNPALADKQIDANFFQHIPYLEDYNQKTGNKLVYIAKVHIEPMGIYSQKIKGAGELTNARTIAIPNDATNGGRALMLLAKAGVIKLKEGAGILATKNDIVEKPAGLTIKELDAAMLPRALTDVDAAVINGNYALEANLNPVKDALVLEDKSSPFANVLVVRPEDKDNPALKKLAEALNTPEVKKFLEEQYQGAVIPAF